MRSNYGLKTLLPAPCCQGPDIGRRGAGVMRATRDAGFECGIHCWDHVVWQDGVMHKPEAWARSQMQRAHDRFAEVFGTAAATCGAAGWQMSCDALRAQGTLGYRYASDARADSASSGPFWPLVKAEPMPVVQIPTTLPTLDEMIGLAGCTTENVHDRLLAMTVQNRRDHVHAARRAGGHGASAGNGAADCWLARTGGYELISTGRYFDRLDTSTLPFCEVDWGTLAGRSGTLLKQGAPYLANLEQSLRR